MHLEIIRNLGLIIEHMPINIIHIHGMSILGDVRPNLI